MTARRAHKNSQKARIILGLLALCALTIIGASPAYAQTDRDTSNRIKRMENEIQTLSRAIYKGEEPPPGAFAGGADTAEMGVRLDQLETQMRDLTGKLEEQTNAIDQLKSQMERMSGDIDVRLNNAANAGGGSAPRYSTVAPTYEVPPPQPATGNYDSSLSTAETAPYPQDNGAYQWSSDNAGEPTLGTIGSVAAPNDAGAMAYESAFSLLKNGQYDAAEQGFTGFLSDYPNHTLSGNAKYWLGETYYARGQYDKASRTFAEAYQQYPKSAKAPDNLLKLGMSLAGMGKKEDACVALGQIEKEYATSAGPVLRRAKQEMTHFGCT